MVYLKSVENVITLGKLIGLLFLFCLPLLSILFLKTKRNDLARPVMGTIFLVYGLIRGVFSGGGGAFAPPPLCQSRPPLSQSRPPFKLPNQVLNIFF